MVVPAGFEAWLREVSPGSFEDGAFIQESWRRWLEELYSLEGPLLRAELETRARLAESTAIEFALVKVLDDAEQLLGYRPLMEIVDEDGSLRIAYLTADSLNQEPPGGLSSPDETEALVMVADAVFDLLAHELWKVPFACPKHGTGLHPRLEANRATWWCETGHHSRGEIGDLKEAAD